ncbi:MAG: c-type cytochrome [Bacteroides sp.]|nr:MAG: c-type cytochrome [Bacteroides sp.]
MVFRFFSCISRLFIYIFFIFFLSFNSLKSHELSNDGSIENGKSLFKNNCSSCHSFHRKLTGPKLQDISKKYSEEWLIKWIYNSSLMIQNGDLDAIKIYKEYNELLMPSFTYLSNQEIKNIIKYIDHESNNKIIIDKLSNNVEKKENYYIDLLLILLIAILLFIFLILYKIRNRLSLILFKSSQSSHKNNLILTLYNFTKIFIYNKKALLIMLLFSSLYLLIFVCNTIWNIGIDQYYQPQQPINFSHKTHVGINNIDCRYCHNEAWKGKNANLPSLNICMNCHNVVDGENIKSDKSKKEIEKLHKMVGFDSLNQVYTKNDNFNIEWIKIHNLPDFAYFNHAQHVVLGEKSIKKLYGLKSNEPVCYACHGNVSTMNEMYQAKKLTMSWCIECHKQAEILNFDNNEYYKNLINIHKNIINMNNVKVADIGGLECSSCHY